MPGRIRIPLHNRESFFEDPFFSDCWDPMDRQQKEWEDEYSNLRSKRLVGDLDDDDLGFRRRLGHRSLRNRVFGLDSGAHDIFMDKERDFGTKSSEAKTETSAAANSELQSDAENFKILLDVQQFKPEELSVNYSEGAIVIEGKQEDKKDQHGFLSCNFRRKYVLPSDVKVDDVQCNLSSDGLLHLSAPRLKPEISNKTAASSSTSSAAATEQSESSKVKKSDDVTSTAQSSSSSTASSAASLSSKARETLADLRSSAERESRKGTTSFGDEDIFGNHSRFGLESDGRYRRGRHIFDSYLTGFPEFDMDPFWSRRRRHDLFDGRSAADAAVTAASSRRTAAKSSEVQTDVNNFKVELDVSGFTPEELSVKMVNNFLIVEARQEEKKDSFGSVYRNFTRKYEIPSDVKPEDIQCIFSTDKMLILRATRSQGQRQNTTDLNEPIRSLKETIVPINAGSQLQSSAAATEHQAQTQASATSATRASSASTSGTGSSTTSGIGSSLSAIRDGREHVVPIRLEQGASDFKNISNAQNDRFSGQSSTGQNATARQSAHNSNDSRATDISIQSAAKNSMEGAGASSSNSNEIPRELSHYRPEKHDSNLLGMLEDFSDKLKTISKSPPLSRKEYNAE